MPAVRARGFRSTVREIGNLPAWGKTLLGNLRALPVYLRPKAIRSLKFILFLLEQEWESTDPVDPVTLELEIKEEEP